MTQWHLLIHIIAKYVAVTRLSFVKHERPNILRYKQPTSYIDSVLSFLCTRVPVCLPLKADECQHSKLQQCEISMFFPVSSSR